MDFHNFTSNVLGNVDGQRCHLIKENKKKNEINELNIL